LANASAVDLGMASPDEAGMALPEIFLLDTWIFGPLDFLLGA
jgi:hypothetical protein